MIHFDKNGLALANGTITVYSFDPQTGVYTCNYPAQIIAGCGVPGNSTPIAPPSLQTNQAAVFNGSAWSVVEDHRNTTVWNKADGSETTVVEIGPLPDTVTTTQPTGPFVTWDDKAGGWMFSQSLRDERLKIQASAAIQDVQKQAAMLTAMGEVFGPQTRECVQKLRAIVSGKDTTSTTLPTVPSDLTT